MYGTVSRRNASEKSFGAVAVCGFAAVVAVAGLVSYATQPAALYSATAVKPVVQTAFVPAQQYVTSAAPAAYAPEYAVSTAPALTASVAVQAAATFAPLALGAAAIAALVAAFFQKKSTPSVYYAAPIAMAATAGERPVWFPGAKAPSHLTGQYPGDRGFDPLGFSKNPKTFERMRIAEVFHGRLAMLGMVGCVFPELLLQKPTWFEVGDSVDFNRFLVIALQCVAPIEYWRGNGGFSWDGNDVPDRSYPGFDPLGLTSDDTKLKEIKNGRLAMVGMLGLEVQNHVTGESPLANLAAHLADPLHVNITTSLAMFSTSGQKTDRPLWFPGGYAPSYLTGKYPGDRGFDPAGFAADPALFEKYRVAEVFHGRLAMLAIVGAVVPDYFGLGAWYEAPDKAGITAEQVAQVVAIAALPEIFRGTSKEKTYPGFDPLKLASDYNKEAEIKNGRLAMIGMLGLEVQHHITGKSPITNLLNHWDHPLNNNIAESLTHPWPVAMFAASGHKDGLWLPGAKPPAHLTGEFIGDRGFDPLSLAVDPTVFARMRIAEIIHGRFAMLGVAGSLLPELLGKGAWFQAGEVVDGTKVALIAFAIAAPTEYWRGQGGFGWDKCTSCDPSYPGFDPLKLSNDRQKLAEIKNGRLAMAAIAGFGAQAAATGESPLANLAAHLADPFGTNITSTLAMFATTGERGVWFPNVKPPTYLTGEFPGDRGFDPAGLAADPKTFARMRVAEVFHGRLAMLGIVGCVFPEVLGNGVWFEAFDKIDAGRATLAALQVIAPLEYWRGNGGFGWNGEAEGRDRIYPGFDPLGLTDDDTKVAEIKNGRLAMIGMLGLEVQNHVTHQGPVANVYAHLADPLGANFAANVVLPWSPVAMMATTGHKAGLWLPGVKPPAHLTGEFIGDRGFDPLGLAVDPTVFARMRVAEIIHGRFAMLGVAGSLLPELLGKGAWFQAGEVVDGTKVALVALAIAAPTEYWRGQGGFGWDKGTGDRAYPGFDPLKLSSDRQKLAEIKNGRLAMAAIAGFGVQAAATGQSPLANLAAHLADPFGTNITSTLAMF